MAATPLKKIPVGEVLRLLFTDAHYRVNIAKAPKAADLTTHPPSVLVRRLQQTYQRNNRWNARIEKQIKKLGYGIYSGGALYLSGEVGERVRTAFTHRQAARLAELKRLRIDAHLDLVGLDPLATRTYLRALRAKLEVM